MFNSIDENVPEYVSAFNELLINEFMNNNSLNKSVLPERKKQKSVFYLQEIDQDLDLSVMPGASLSLFQPQSLLWFSLAFWSPFR